MNIRDVKLEDSSQITEIYNHYILNTHHTFETKPLEANEMQDRIKEVIKDYPYLVAEEDGAVLGYAYATDFKLRQAYENTSEVSIYVNSDSKQKGIGTQLYEGLFEELEDLYVHAIVAGIALPNDPSIKFHEKLGFEKVAHFREIGYKLGRWIDVGYWEVLTK